MEIKKVSEQQLANNCADSESKVTEGPVTSRRTFTRNVLVGSAVLLTLSNRSAWAATETVCVSTNLLMSYNNGQPSALNDLQNAEIENFYDYTKYPIDKRKNEREENGDTCFDINGPHVNSDNSDNSGSYFLLDETTSSEL
jgi:hypothetical protein